MYQFVFFLVLYTACTDESAIFTSDFLLYEVHTTGDPTDVLYAQQYTLSAGKVLSEEYTNYMNPEYSHSSTFSYDEEGRVIEENQDGTITSISWEGNTAKIYLFDGDMLAHLELEGDKILVSQRYNGDSVPEITSFGYDDSENVISIESPQGTLKTLFLDYNMNKMYPLHLIRSISILRMSYRAHFRNIFSIEQQQPFEGDDFSIGLSDYQYTYTFDEQGRVAIFSSLSTLVVTSGSCTAIKVPS